MRAPVRPLAIQLSRIVILPEDVEQLLVGELRRIVLDLYCFGVARVVGADIFVRRVGKVSARVPNPR